MPRINYLSDFVETLFDRPRTLWRGSKTGSIEQRCADLLKDRTEVSSLQIASEILSRFDDMGSQERLEFFEYLNDQLDVSAADISTASDAYANDASPENYRKLMRAAEPNRFEWLRRLNRPAGATAEIVRMRTALLKQIAEHPDLARTDTDFALMLRSWFNRGFLVLRQITWDSPASILEKLIKYEAVHEIETWPELRRRLHPVDRRCFAFFHPAMPDEPLIFVEIALSKGIPVSIQDVLADKRETLDADAADTAVFYSISNCQKGLAGISFGNSLIKQVVRDLAIELPSINSFVTLSPIPGFKQWLSENGLDIGIEDKANLRRLAAYYLVRAKSVKGRPMNSVARFHLANGAHVHAIHADADVSESGRSQSSGLMVNYAYDFAMISKNLAVFAEKNQVAASNSVKILARQGAVLVKKN